MSERNYELFDKVVETIGYEELAKELLWYYMSTREMNEALESIATTRDVEIEE